MKRDLAERKFKYLPGFPFEILKCYIKYGWCGKKIRGRSLPLSPLLCLLSSKWKLEFLRRGNAEDMGTHNPYYNLERILVCCFSDRVHGVNKALLLIQWHQWTTIQPTKQIHKTNMSSLRQICSYFCTGDFICQISFEPIVVWMSDFLEESKSLWLIFLHSCQCVFA